MQQIIVVTCCTANLRRKVLDDKNHVRGIEGGEHSSDVAGKHIIAQSITSLRSPMSPCLFRDIANTAAKLNIKSYWSIRRYIMPGSSAKGVDTALFLESHFWLPPHKSTCQPRTNFLGSTCKISSISRLTAGRVNLIPDCLHQTIFQ